MVSAVLRADLQHIMLHGPSSLKKRVYIAFSRGCDRVKIVSLIFARITLSEESRLGFWEVWLVLLVNFPPSPAPAFVEGEEKSVISEWNSIQ